MFFGNKNKFAIECEISERIDDWVFGNFIFWACGSIIGDSKDSTDLKGCLRWLKNFVDEDRDRFEPELIGMDKVTVFKLLYNSVINIDEAVIKEAPKFKDIFSRFHISHIGMSSFEQFDILLIEPPNDYQRFLWRYSGDNEVKECYLPEKEIQKVGTHFITWLEKEIQ